ncbi:MAG: hypothetical protein WAV70_09275, partial [Anaerolineae bacterium]
MQNQRRWLPILILILIVLCLLLYFLLRPLIPIIPGTPTPTPTSVRDLRTPTATATRTPTATPTLAPKPVWGPGNYILVRRDETEHIPPPPAGFPALASHINVIWDRVLFKNSELDWSAIETQVAQIASQHVTLANGTAIPRPVWLTLPVFWRQGPDEEGRIKCLYSGPEDYLLTVAPPLAPVGQKVPAFNHSGFKDQYRNFVRQAGAKWNNDSRIAGIIIAGGYDNETQIGANYCHVEGEATSFPVTKQQMTDFVTNAIQAFHDAFPDKPVYLNFAPAPTDQARCDWVN